MGVVVFDLDGVLIDSTAANVDAWSTWLAERGLPRAKLREITVGRRPVDNIRTIAPLLDAPREAAALLDRLFATTVATPAFDGAAELLNQLPPDRWAVVTSAEGAVARWRLARSGLPQPAVLVCAGDVARGKPDPECYLSAALRLGVPAARCLVVEDAPAGVEAGKAAGMAVAAVCSSHQRGDLHKADAVFDRLADATAWLLAHIDATG